MTLFYTVIHEAIITDDSIKTNLNIDTDTNMSYLRLNLGHELQMGP